MGTFRKAHNQKSFKLCIYDRLSKKSRKTKKPDSLKQKLSSVPVKKPDLFVNSFLVPSFAHFGVDECYVKQRWSFLPVETKKKLEERFKMLQAKQIDYELKRTKFLHELASMIPRSRLDIHI